MSVGHIVGIVVVFALLGVGISCRSQHRGSDTGNEVSGEQLKDWVDREADVCVLDVRSKEEYASGHIPGAMNINYTDISARLDELEPYRNQRIVVYCRTGRRARIAEATLVDAGFDKVYLLIGDMIRWRQAGWPTETDD